MSGRHSGLSSSNRKRQTTFGKCRRLFTNVGRLFEKASASGKSKTTFEICRRQLWIVTRLFEFPSDNCQMSDDFSDFQTTIANVGPALAKVALLSEKSSDNCKCRSGNFKSRPTIANVGLTPLGAAFPRNFRRENASVRQSLKVS